MAATPGHADDRAMRREASGSIESMHTPGPWASKYDRTDEAYLVSTVEPVHPIRPDVGQHIASLGAYQPNVVANARLITAAPKLLAALQAMVRVADGQGSRWRAKLPDGNSPLGLAYAAIEKATGQSPATPSDAHGALPSDEKVGQP